MSHQRRHAGFSMIELMMVTAIIAVLATAALPLYLQYVARSQAAAGLADITPGKTAYEHLISQGVADNGSFSNVDNLGLAADTPRCVITSNAPVNGLGNITCALKGSSLVEGKLIELVRDTQGNWSCLSDLAAPQLPGGCTAED